MRTLIYSLLIFLLILIQSQGSSGDAVIATAATLELVTTTMGQVGDIFKSYEKLDAVDDAVGKSNFKTPILFKIFTNVGAKFAPIWGIITLAIGSLAGDRQSQLLKMFDSIGQDISSVYTKLDSQTRDLKSEMRRIQHDNQVPELITASERYQSYLNGLDPDNDAALLVNYYKNDIIRTQVTALRRSIRSYISTSMNHHGDCKRLTDERIWLTTLLSNAGFALGIGCVEYAKQKKYTEAKTHRICDNLNSYKKIVEIEKIMIEEINKCTTSFAKAYTKEWLQEHIRTKDIDGTSKKISSMLTEKFPQFSHTVVVYPPLHGFSEHTTDFGVTLFRWKEMNIVVSILYRREKSCGSHAKNLNRFLTYTIEEKSREDDYGVFRWRAAVKDQNDGNAENLYTKLTRYGNDRLLVFKGSQYSVNGYPNKIWCEILYSDVYSRDTTIVYV